MTTPLVQELREAIDSNMMDGSSRRVLHVIADRFEAEALAGSGEPFLYVREVDAGTDNACWVIANAVDPGAIPLFDTPSRAGGGEVGEIQRVADELRAYNPPADPYKGEHIHKVWAKQLEAALNGAGARGGDS